jgi:hypothetical protein
MAKTLPGRSRWTSNLMMVLSIVVVCVVVPMGFILGGPFAGWLRSVGIHPSPNLADGYPIAEFEGFERVPGVASGGSNSQTVPDALAIRSFSIKKVAFRPLSGMGIAPRLNLCFEFDGRLPDPQNSGREFSATVIHVYLRAPNKPETRVVSDRIPAVDFAGPAWTYQVVVDGLHDQARIFDARGKLLGRGLGLYVRHEDPPAPGPQDGSRRSRTLLTAALPMELVGDPSTGDWLAYIVLGLSDSRHPSMMLHSGPEGGLAVYSGALMDGGTSGSAGKPRLRPLLLRKPA